jgi:hypothetical protein
MKLKIIESLQKMRKKEESGPNKNNNINWMMQLKKNKNKTYKMTKDKN